ncbi:hypothetical protein CEXT_496921 [Caerostris extrusa]|uniref:Uncharacterized protein n=1 Tax=Caerostris extrusa TaxID=172846 RepID=A0AAV4V8Z9_CAEEX|nr:hypothetical protein CEXT_496921 [Caerostris extrusa]
MYANASIEIQLHTAANLKFRATFSDLVSPAKVVDAMSRYCVMLRFASLQFYVKMPEWPCPTEGGEEDIKIKVLAEYPFHDDGLLSREILDSGISRQRKRNFLC